MVSTYSHGSPVSRGVVLNNATVVAGNTVTSSAIDNSVNQDILADFRLVIVVPTTPTNNPYAEFRLRWSIDGVEIESVDASDRLDIVPLSAGTIRRLVRGVHIDPYHFFVSCFNASNVDISVTVEVFTRRMAFNP